MQEADLPGRRWLDLLSQDWDLNMAQRAYTLAFESPESVPPRNARWCSQTVVIFG